jgi:hypothetical protein
MGQLGLQWIAACCLASLNDSGAVHRRKMAQTTTWLDGTTVEGVCAGGAERTSRCLEGGK